MIAFARVAALADVFVQDLLIPVTGRASIVGIQNFCQVTRASFEEEATELERALTPKHPSLAVIGGTKFGTKAVLAAC